MIITIYWIQPVKTSVALKLHREYVRGSIKPASNNLSAYIPEPQHGRFPQRMNHLFHQIFPRDYSGATYYEPDSGNTTFHWLNAWPDDENTLLIETGAGYAGGSCGCNIVVVKFDTVAEKWTRMVDECGWVDSVYNISHNGLHDFLIGHRWDESERYIFDGKAFVPLAEEIVLTDSQQVKHIIAEREGYGDWVDFTFSMQSVVLDSSKCPYYIANESALERCLIHEERPGEFKLINVFEDADEIDILQKKHLGMPDIHTPCWNGRHIYYRWNGSQYVEYKRVEWVPDT